MSHAGGARSESRNWRPQKNPDNEKSLPLNPAKGDCFQAGKGWNFMVFAEEWTGRRAAALLFFSVNKPQSQLNLKLIAGTKFRH